VGAKAGIPREATDVQDVLEALENRAASLQLRSVTAYGKERRVLRGDRLSERDAASWDRALSGPGQRQGGAARPGRAG
jgi:hypothetical protein